ncbi:MAG: hypothetical protein U0930_24525 [Pirellulales bacterium]
MKLLLGSISLLIVLLVSSRGAQAQQLGFQARQGDEIMVCGQFYRIGTPVKLWFDPQGFDAYRTQRRFSSFEVRKWKDIVEEMKAGKVEFVSASRSKSYIDMECVTSRAPELWSPEQLEQIRGGGWTLPLLQDKVDQFVLHFWMRAEQVRSACDFARSSRVGVSTFYSMRTARSTRLDRRKEPGMRPRAMIEA